MSARSRFIVGVTLAYALLAAVWIFLSDQMLSHLADVQTITRLATVKGMIFIALTSGFLALALRYVPPAGGVAERPTNVALKRRWPAGLIIIIVALTATIGAIAVVSHQVQTAMLKDAAVAQLETVVKANVDSLEAWFNERRANARQLGTNMAFARLVERWRQTPNPRDHESIIGQLSNFREAYQFASIDLWDPDRFWVLDAGDGRDFPLDREQLAKASSGRTIIEDIRLGDSDYMRLISPLFEDGQPSNPVIAILAFNLKPQAHLASVLRRWPLPNASGELMMSRRDGDHIVIMNGPRQDTRVAADDLRYAGIQAHAGKTRIVDAIDMKGVRVLAAARRVDGTPWLLLAKIDEAEALAPLHGIARNVVLLLLAVFAVAVAIVMVLWQRQQLRQALTEVAQARAVEAAETRLKATFEQAAVGIVHADLEGRFLRINQRLCDILGYQRDELSAKRFDDLRHPDDAAAEAPIADLIGDGVASLNDERRYVCKDGTIVWLALTTSVAHDNAGAPDYLIVVVQDISQRVAAKEALRKSEERFQLAMRASNDGIWDHDLTTDKVWLSPRCNSMLGHPGEEAVIDAVTWSRRVHPDDLPRLFESRSMVAAGRQDRYEIELRSRHRDGHWVDVLSRGFLVRSPDGKPIRIVGTHVDITERRRREAKLRQAMTVFESTREGVVITDARADIIAANPAFTTIMGYAESELVGHNMRIVQSGRHDRAFYRQLWSTIETADYWQGEVWNRRKNGEIFPARLGISAVRDDKGVVVNYVGTFSDVTHIKESETRLEHLAHHDPLTELPNRLLLRSRVEHAIARARRNGSHGAVLILDLDRFKTINESLGFQAGDRLLCAVATRMVERLRDIDTVARLGADEFGILLEDLAGSDDARRVAESLTAALAEPFTLDEGREAYTGASIGVTLFPDDGDDADRLLQNAETALHQAKSNRGAAVFYTSLLTAAARARIELEDNLRRALERDEFVLHYQPLVTIDADRVKGVEALVRWAGPGSGAGGTTIPPSLFIPVAEETGLIVPLGEWVLRTACTQMRQWVKDGLPCDFVSVNLSPVQFLEPDLPERIAAILIETGLPAHHLELEITEGVLLDHTEESQARLARLKALGVSLAVDDFGIGYSSLGYLKRLPVDKLKIDKSFVDDLPGDAANVKIVTAVISLAHSLRLEVLAEGVEKRAQLAFLRRNGCDSAQGFLFSRPLPAGEVPNAVRRINEGRIKTRRARKSGGVVAS